MRTSWKFGNFVDVRVDAENFVNNNGFFPGHSSPNEQGRQNISARIESAMPSTAAGVLSIKTILDGFAKVRNKKKARGG
jgi:hypothetical protein